MLGFSAKLYPNVLGLTATLDPRVIFIRILNLHDLSLSESSCNTGPKSSRCGFGSCHKSDKLNRLIKNKPKEKKPIGKKKLIKKKKSELIRLSQEVNFTSSPLIKISILKS